WQTVQTLIYSNIMSRMPELDTEEIRDTFRLFDIRGDEKIEARQIGEVVRALGLNPTEAEIKKAGYDKQPDTRITFETFLPIYKDLAKNADKVKPEQFIDGFRVFDKDQNGTISAAELRHLLTSLGEKLKDEEVEQLLAGMDDIHGNINYEDLVRNIMSG
ncbi:hypothetical protein BOX15_Mlig006818g2, partial [Macrostomum lignano]